MLRTTVAATGDRKHWAEGNWANPTLQGLCSQKQHLSIHGLSKQIGFRDISNHVWAAAADLNQSETILWFYDLSQNSPREKKGNAESRNHSTTVSMTVPSATTHPLASPVEPQQAWLGQVRSVWDTDNGVPENQLPLVTAFTAGWQSPCFPHQHLLGEPWHQPASLLLSPAVPVWRREAGDPLRPYIFQKEPFGCQQEDSTLIVTQESLISWEKTLIAASSPRGCRWHGFHHHHHPQHASGTLAICFQFWMSKCLTGEVLGNAFFPLHLLLWLSKNGKKTSREIREEVWGLNNVLTDSIPLQKLGILLA